MRTNTIARGLAIGFLLAAAACGGSRAGRDDAKQPADASEAEQPASPDGGVRDASAPDGGDRDAAVEPEPEPIGAEVDFTPAPKPEPQEIFALSTRGNPALLSTELGSLELDMQRAGPLTVLGDCTAWVMECVEPPARTLDDCMRSAPRCTSEEPWRQPQVCCPSACYDGYAELRRAGAESHPAFTQVFFEDEGCVPGVAAMLAPEGN